MKFDSRYSAPIRPIFRIPATIIGAAQLILGIIYLADGGFKVGLPQTIMGIMFLTAGITGRLPKFLDSEERNREIEKQISEGKSVTRKMCLISLGGFVFVISVLFVLFLTSELFSFGWWVAIALTIFISIGFYFSAALLLEMKGFNPFLALTIITPVALLVIGVINPKKFEQIGIA